MSEGPPRRAPAGWYAEQGQSGYRFWDGQSWAESNIGAGGQATPWSDSRASPARQRIGLACLGAAVALLVVGLVLPWAEAGSEDQRLLDGGIPWLWGPGSVADSWLLIPLGAVVLRVLLSAALAGNGPRRWLTAVVAGVAIMGFCVAEGLAMDDDLDMTGARVGLGLFVTYAGGAATAVGGALFKPGR